jgi:hypothetical protein
MAMMVTTDKAATATTAATAANCDEERHSAASSSGSDLQPPRLIADLNSSATDADDLPSAEAPDVGARRPMREWQTAITVQNTPAALIQQFKRLECVFG